MANLMSFVLNTLQGPLNNPGNTDFWLPKQLADMKDGDGKPVLPITSGSANIGALQGQGGDYIASQFAQDWFIAGGSGEAIPDPDNPQPLLELSKLSVNGLDNATLTSVAATPAAAGYDITLVVAFGQYTGAVSGHQMVPLTLSTDYKITQWLCLKGADGKCKGDAFSITGTGSLVATIRTPVTASGKTTYKPAFMEAVVSVTVGGTGASRAMAFEIASIKLQGETAGSLTGIQVESLEIFEKKYANLAQLIEVALGNPQGQASLLDAVGTMLNGEQNRSAVSGVLTKNSQSVVNKIFGDLPSGGLPTDDSGQTAATPIDLLLFDRMRAALSVPNSNWYLPWQLAGSSNPVMEPYTNAELKVPDQTLKGLKYTDISLTNLSVAGLSNVAAPPANVILTSPEIAVELLFSTMPKGPDRQVSRSGGKVTMPVPPAPPLTITGGFNITQQGAIAPVALKGDLTLTVAGLTADATITPSGTQASNLVMTISGVKTNTTGASFDPSIQLVPANPALQGAVNDLFQSGSVKGFLGTFLKQKIETEEADLSTEFTKIARAAIKSQLGE